jgi:hypothetical protein
MNYLRRKMSGFFPDSPGGLAVRSLRPGSRVNEGMSPLRQPDCNPSVRCTPIDSHLPTFRPRQFMLVRPS